MPENNLSSKSPQQIKMMQQGVGYPVRITASNNKEANGEIRIQTFNQKERIFRAVKFLFILWVSAVLSVFIPILHFILVPLLFLVGIIVAAFVYQTQSVVLGGEAICPNCNAFLPLVRNTNKWPLTDSCSHCRTEVTITKENHSL